MGHLSIKCNGGQRWKLKYVARLKHEGDDCDGRCDYDDRTILIRKGLDPQAELETLLHEIQHAQDERLNESFVSQVAKETAAIMWKLGYRKTPGDAARGVC